MTGNGTAGEEPFAGAPRIGGRFGDCDVKRLIGAGGAGAVYLVVSPGGEEYALKVMDPAVMKRGPEYVARFVREAEFSMGIRHKNLITIHDAGVAGENGLCYILMDYMSGGSLTTLLARRGALPVGEAVAIATQIAYALEAAHSRGVIHRDVKPDNILFAADGTPKLADLGVARFRSTAADTTATIQGMIVGTPAYMAPEQMVDSHHVDARADTYSLGVVLYEMLTGKRPNDGSTIMGILAKAVRGDPLPDVREMRPEISAAVACVLSLMCAPDPADRPKTARAAGDLLVRADSDSLLIGDSRTIHADGKPQRGRHSIPDLL